MKHRVAALFFIALALDLRAADGPFQPEWNSLKTHQDPEWFRDAKFGIYTHWGPVTVGCEDCPKGGQWYGKEMYESKSPVSAYHKNKYGDPNVVGYKDMIPKFTAQKFDPEKWADLFARAGAKFAGPVAVHHDNFAMWDSAVTPFNAAKMGPKRDVVGELAKAYRARGMKFLPTFHHGFAWRYFEPSFPFDGADGKNFLLYTEPHGPKDPPSQRFLDQWLGMVMECVQKYEPDMIWFDFELQRVITPEYQQRMFADYYNWAATHGKESAVAHKFREIHEHTGILDFERGREDKLVPYPWLTDTALGPWFNQKSEAYRSTDNLVHVLADIVSKNGCMLLNVGPEADGTIPAAAEKMLLELGDWLKVNGEAIYATRPWKVFGEGPTRDKKGGGFSERGDKKFTPQDIRFTQSKDGATLYAIALGVPKGPVCIRSLAVEAGKVASVALLGSSARLTWSQSSEGLVVELPSEQPCAYAVSLKIAGENLNPAPLPPPDLSPKPRADGSILLEPASAELHGDKIRVEERHGHEYLAAWDKPSAWASWQVPFPAKAAYEVEIVCSAASGDTRFVLELAGVKLAAGVKKTKSWYDYTTISLGKICIDHPGKLELALRAESAQTWKPLNVREVRIQPVGGGATGEGAGEFGAYAASKAWTPPTDPATLQKLREWQGLKFGVLLDWQACTQWGIDSWPLCPERYAWNTRKDWVHGTSQGAEQDNAKYKANYEALKKTFRPVKFDPDQWAGMLKGAGVRYALIMAKHHDGFCLWDTAQTDYKTTSKDCPFHELPGADTVKSIGEALRRQGIRVGIYFSKPDWNTPFFWDPALPFAKNRNANYDPRQRPEVWKKFKDFTWAQIEELMSKYGPIDILWLDGGWVQPRSNAQDIDMDGIAAMARKHQPGLLVVDRTVKGSNENYITPEGVHAMPASHQPYPWEACMPLTEHWNYFPNDTCKSAGTLVRYLCRCAGRGGNYLLGIGPDASGAFEPPVTERLEAVGAWLKLNGEAIYDTAPIKPYEQNGCVFTAKRDGTVYAILLANDDAGKLPATVALPAELVARAKSIALLGFGRVEAGETKDGVTTIVIPGAARKTSPCDHAWTIKLAP